MISEGPGKREETKQNKGQKWADDRAHPINGYCPAVVLRFFSSPSSCMDGWPCFFGHPRPSSAGFSPFAGAHPRKGGKYFHFCISENGFLPFTPD